MLMLLIRSLFIVLFLSYSVAAVCAGKEKQTPLFQAHAHNDYEHARPLHDALEHGFWSVEADIYLVDGELFQGRQHLPLVGWRLGGEQGPPPV